MDKPNALRESELQIQLSRWYAVGDATARDRIVRASGEHELAASRILRAFDAVEYQTSFDQARSELLRNEALSLRVVFPVIKQYMREKTEKTLYEAYRVVSFASEIAETETNGLARSYLERIVQVSDGRVRESAMSSLSALFQDNVAIRSERYLKNHTECDLRWIVEHLFPNDKARIRSDPLLRTDVVRYLGSGTKEGLGLKYTGEDEDGQTLEVRILFSDEVASDAVW